MPRQRPEVSASVLAAAEAAGVPPPTPEQITKLTGAQVVLDPESAASAGARGVYNNIADNTLLRDAGYVEMGLDPTDPSGELTDPEVPSPPTGEGGAAPTNVDVPFVQQAGSALNCTMGNWTGEPTSYSYAWQIGGNSYNTANGLYTVQPIDVGLTAACVVSATNSVGTTAAPPSNSVVVA